MFYKPDPHGGINILYQVFRCIWFAIINTLKGNPKKVTRWIDASLDKYSETFISDVVAYLKVSESFLINKKQLLKMILYLGFEIIFTPSNILGTFGSARFNMDISGNST